MLFRSGYINIDPGTMSPYQHGEVYVTEDGAETDLDLGHYERFIDENLNKYSNLTTGKVYWNVLTKERKGEYLGETVQVIPHITDEIKSFIYSVGEKTDADIVITEIGGTTGDIESQPYLEAIRQVANEQGRRNCLFIHVTLIPYLEFSGEHKSKPTQHSVKELQSFGIMPDIIVARCDRPLEKSIFAKIAKFCNVSPDCVIENRTVPLLYEAPVMLKEQGLDKVVLRELSLEDKKDFDFTEWENMIASIKQCEKSVNIALVGKYVKLHDSYLSVSEALSHAGWANGTNVNVMWIDSETITDENVGKVLERCDGIIIPGGFGSRGIEGMISAAKYALKNNIPYFGICLGMQIASIAFARDILKFEDANSKEFDVDGKNKVIDLMNDQKYLEEMGGTMRLGAYPCKVKRESKLYEMYQEHNVSERHRHRYEFNNDYREAFEENGIVFSGVSPDNRLVEAVEYSKNNFFVGVQYHPEFKSRPNKPHPVFKGFIKAAMIYNYENGRECK